MFLSFCYIECELLAVFIKILFDNWRRFCRPSLIYVPVKCPQGGGIWSSEWTLVWGNFFLSLSNMNNVHNTFIVATLIYNVVQHFLSQLQKTMLSLPPAFNTSNALEYLNQRWKYPLFRPNAEARSRLAAMFVVPWLSCDFRTCAIWLTLSRAAFEPIDKCEMNFRWIVQIHADFTSDRVVS